jgi:hypothetical protein
LVITGATAPTGYIGTTVEDVLTVENRGSRLTECPMVEVTLPPGLRFLSGSSSQGTLSAQGNQVTARLGYLPMLGTAQVSLRLQVEAAGTLQRSYRARAARTTTYPAYEDTVSLSTSVPKVRRR